MPISRPAGPRSTPAGSHMPVLLDAVLEALAPKPGEIALDCTLGFAGHTLAIAARLGPTGRLIALDRDADNLARVKGELAAAACPVSAHHSNFAAAPAVLAAEGIDGVDVLLADLGMSSMQVDDPARGFSYMRDGPLDMRMDRTKGKTAAELLATIPQAELADALSRLGDEPEAGPIAAALVAARGRTPMTRTGDVVRVIEAAAPRRSVPRHRPGHKALHPAARTFQALRMLVNRELGNLTELLRVLPQILRPAGRAGIISFHSGEDRLVKDAFRAGEQAGVYSSISPDPVRADDAEVQSNPRSRSAKLRWAVRAE